MSKLNYLNFDVRIDALRHGYRAWISEAPVAGEAAVQFQLPEEVTRVLLPEDLSAAKTLGGKLFEMVFDGDMLAYLRRSRRSPSRGTSNMSTSSRLLP